MKRLFKSMGIIAVAAMSLVACNKEIAPQEKVDGQYKYTFSILEDTKAVIGDSNVEWVAGDQVGMFVGNYKGYAKIDVETTPKMVVIYSNEAIPAGTVAYAYAPYDAENKNGSADLTKIVLNDIQSGSSVSAMPLAGIPFEVETEVAASNQEGNGAIQFLNLGSVINFKVFSTDAALQNEIIQSIKFEANKTIAGTGYLDLTSVDVNNESSLELTFMATDDEKSVVRVDQEVAIATSKDEATPIKMVVLPGTFGGTLTVTTDVATYTKIVPEREYTRSGARTWGLDLAGTERHEGIEVVEKTLPYEEAFTFNHGDFTIENVTLPANQSSIWTFDSSYGAKVTAYISSVNYAAESWLISPVINLTDVSAAEITFDQCVNKYLKPGDGSLQIKEYGTDTWTTIANTYPATSNNWSPFEEFKVNLASYVGKKIVFAFKYVSSSESAGTWEIKNFAVNKVKSDAGLSFESESAEATIGETFTAPTLTNPNELEVTYTSSNESVATVASNGAITIIARGETTITASFAGNDDFNADEASYTLTVIDPNVTINDFTWDLTEASYSSASTTFVSWSNNNVEMKTTQATGATAANNYLPTSQSSTRFYKNNSLSFTPGTGVTITKVEYTATTANYANALAGSVWTNAKASVDNTLVTIIPTDGTATFSAVLGATTGASAVKIFYIGGSAIVTLSSIEVTTLPTKTTYNVGEAFDFSGAVVTATYSDGSTADVTSNVTTDGDTVVLSAGEDKDVTVSYQDQTATFQITVEEVSGYGLKYTLSPAEGSNNSYSGDCDVAIAGVTWNVTGNAQMVPWRLGGKSIKNTDRAIYSKTAITDNISKIEITHGNASEITVNSMTVIVATDAAFANVVSTLAPTFTANETVTVERPSGVNWSNCYYKFVYNVTVSATKNKFLEFSQAKFTGN